MSTEAKWRANQKKVAFMKRFPGLLSTWDQSGGKTVERVVPLPSRPGRSALIFSDYSFVIVSAVDPEPFDIAAGLGAMRPSLESVYPEAYAEYDRLVSADKEALRVARLDKIMGAIQNNMKDIPDLKDRVRLLVKEWDET